MSLGLRPNNPWQKMLNPLHKLVSAALFLAALVVGIADTALKYYVPQFGAFFIYALTMAILLRYPHGIFGRT